MYRVLYMSRMVAVSLGVIPEGSRDTSESVSSSESVELWFRTERAPLPEAEFVSELSNKLSESESVEDSESVLSSSSSPKELSELSMLDHADDIDRSDRLERPLGVLGRRGRAV